MTWFGDYVRRGLEAAAEAHRGPSEFGDYLMPEAMVAQVDALLDAEELFPVEQPGELYANPAASQNMLDDAAFDVEAWLVSETAREFARTGVATEGPISLLRDPYTNKPFVHFYVTRKAALAAGSGTAETNEDSAQCEASQSGGEAVTPKGHSHDQSR